MTRLERAMAAHRRGELADAEAGYRQVLAGADEADEVEAHQLLGVLLHRKGSHAEALEHLDRALALDAEHAGAHANRGLVLQALGRLSDAQQAFLDALEDRHRLRPVGLTDVESSQVQAVSYTHLTLPTILRV